MKKASIKKIPAPRNSTANRHRLILHSAVLTGGLRRDYVLRCAQLAARKLPERSSLISFIIVSDKEMAKMHRRYSGVSGTTDVLTFDLSDPNGGIEGEIYICFDQARRQAAEYKISLSEEVARLAIHGVLHLAGFDDHTEAQRELMRDLEDRLLKTGRKTV